MVPFELTLRAVSVFERHTLLKLKQLVHEAEMWLDNNIEASSPYITAAIISGCKKYHKIVGTHYARGRESFRALMTSAIQIVAERETPTRQ